MTTTGTSLPADKQDLTAKQRYWLAHIKACEALGQSLATYAAEHHLALKSCYRWKSRLTQLGLLAETATTLAAPPVFRSVQIKRKRDLNPIAATQQHIAGLEFERQLISIKSYVFTNPQVTNQSIAVRMVGHLFRRHLIACWF